MRRRNHPTLDKCEHALNWCKNREITEKEALNQICADHEFEDVEIKYSSELANAIKIIRSKKFNWGGQGNISLNYNIANMLKASSILETGVAYGWSSLSF